MDETCVSEIEELASSTAALLVDSPKNGPNGNLSAWVLPEVCSDVENAVRNKFLASCKRYFTTSGLEPFDVGKGIPFTQFNNTNPDGNCIDNSWSGCTINETYWAAVGWAADRSTIAEYGFYSHQVFMTLMVSMEALK